MYSIAIHPDRQLAVFRFEGEMTLTEGKRAFMDYVARPEFEPDALMVTDGRRVTGISADFTGVLSTVHTMGAAFRKFNRASKSVILVADNTQFGMARMLEQILDWVGPIKIIVVRTGTELRRETGLTLAELEALTAAPLD